MYLEEGMIHSGPDNYPFELAKIRQIDSTPPPIFGIPPIWDGDKRRTQKIWQ